MSAHWVPGRQNSGILSPLKSWPLRSDRNRLRMSGLKPASVLVEALYQIGAVADGAYPHAPPESFLELWYAAEPAFLCDLRNGEV